MQLLILFRLMFSSSYFDFQCYILIQQSNYLKVLGKYILNPPQAFAKASSCKACPLPGFHCPHPLLFPYFLLPIPPEGGLIPYSTENYFCLLTFILNYSHSIVEGGLELISYTTLLIPFTLLIISLEINPRNS